MKKRRWHWYMFPSSETVRWLRWYIDWCPAVLSTLPGVSCLLVTAPQPRDQGVSMHWHQWSFAEHSKLHGMVNLTSLERTDAGTPAKPICVMLRCCCGRAKPVSHLCLLDAFQFLLLRELPLLAGDAIGLLSYFQRVLLQLNATYSRIFTKWLITNTFSYQYLENLRFYGTFPIPAPEVCTFSASSCFWAKVSRLQQNQNKTSHPTTWCQA